jgi:polyisoprenoid-binding protein YceI
MNWNKKLKLTQLVIIAALLLLACEKPPKGDDAKITEEEQAIEPTGKTFVVDTANSWAKFTGYGVGKNHPGMFKLSYGTVSVNKDSVSGGSFIIDIKSMRMQQKGKDIETKLRPHLLSGDFFDAEKFSTAKFEVTNIVPYDPEKDTKKSLVEGANFYVSGNLTLKDETKNISFPVRIDIDGQTIKAKANFDIDRTQWKMNYGNDKTLGDKFIDEKVNIEFYVEALDQKGAV